MNQKHIFVAVGVFLLLALGGGFWVWEKKQIVPQPKQETPVVQQPTQTDEVESVKDLVDGEYTFTPIDTSDWQTYRNEELGFEVKVPNFLTIKEENTGYIQFIAEDDSQKPVNENQAISFYIYATEGLRNKNMNTASKEDFFDAQLFRWNASGNIDIFERNKSLHNLDMRIVGYLFKKEPPHHDIEAWTEGFYIEKVFFQCKSNICTIEKFTDTYSQDKQILFYTVLSTLRLIQ